MAETVTTPHTDATAKASLPVASRVPQFQQQGVSLRGDGMRVSVGGTGIQQQQQQSAVQFHSQQQLLQQAKAQAEQPAAEAGKKQGGAQTEVVTRDNTVLADTAQEKPVVAKAATEEKPALTAPAAQDKETATTENTAPAVESAMEKAPAKPQDDPSFQAILAQVDQTADKQQQHPDAHSRVAQSQDASQIDPALEKGSQAGKTQVGVMSEQPKKGFEAKAFKDALMQSINGAMPENEKKAKEFKQSNELGKVQQQVQGQVQAGKEQSTGPLQQATTSAPATDLVTVKQAVPLKEEKSGAKPVIQKTNLAAPKPKTEAEISLKTEAAEPDKLMAENKVTDGQLAGSNEPSFTKALDSKNEAREQAEDAPAQYRLAEGPALAGAQAGAGSLVGGAMGAMAGIRGAAFGGVSAGKAKAKAGDEQVRKRVAGQMLAIYSGTKKNVEAILAQLDRDVFSVFTTGITKANKTFEDNVARRLDEFYGISRIDDFFKQLVNGLPKEIDDIFQDEKLRFIKTMEPVIDRVAQIVETGLNKASAEVEKGKKQLEDYWKAQPAETKKIAGDAYKEINGKYEELEKQVEDKQQGLITALTEAYVNTVGGLQEKFDTIRSQSMGLLGMALDYVGGVIKVILQMKDMLLGTFSRVSHVVEDIIAHPIEFLGNMVEAVGTGFRSFAVNSLQHLKTGFFEWLMGAVPAGIQFPDKWDLRGIFGFVMQMFSLTWDAIKTKVVKKVGQPVMDALETGFEIFTVIKKDGIGGLWEYIKEKVGDLKTMVVDGLMDMLQSQVIQAGITWLLGLLTPAGAFVKACQMIYKITMWFINNAQRMLELVNTIVDSAADIVAHNLAGASAKVENAMAKVIPIAIGFLAGVIGIGNLSKKVGDIIDRVKVPITKAIDWVVEKAVAFADKLGITKMIEKGTKWVQDKVAKIGDKVMGWLGIKKQFKTEDGKSHSVYTEQKGDDIEILVASKVQTLKELIAEKKESFKPKRKDTPEEKSEKAAKMTRANDAEIKYKEIKGLIPDLIVEKLKEDTEKKIELKITELVPILKDIGVEGTISDEELLDTDIEYSPDNGKAHKIIGRVISKKGSGGSEPKDDPFGWTKEVKELANSEAYWVRAHLLNASLHGKGTKDNLVPGTKTTNNSMRSSVEDPAKEAVFVQNKMIYYNVEVSYYAEQNGVFPEYIKIDWGFLKKGDGNTLIKEVNQGRRFQQELPPNEHMRSFSQSSKDRITEAFKEAGSTFGVSRTSVVDAIIEVRENLPGREFITESQFYNEMKSYYKKINIDFDISIKKEINKAISKKFIKILI